MRSTPDILAMARKASARGVAHAEEAMRERTSAERQERHALIAAVYFAIAFGLIKVRITK